MKREQAVEMLKAKLECMTRDVSGTNMMCNKHKCDECQLNYSQGNNGEQIECLRISIEAINEVIKSENFVKELVSKAFSGTSYEEICRKRKGK